MRQISPLNKRYRNLAKQMRDNIHVDIKDESYRELRHKNLVQLNRLDSLAYDITPLLVTMNDVFTLSFE